MRNAFAQEITRLAQEDPRVVVLSGDIGNRLFDDLKSKCPGRFLNCGVAEANMVGMAAGLAMSGLRPVCYTIAPFLTYRCMEQIRVDLCYHHVPVVLVGTGAGLSYASLGATHHSCEEVGMLRLLPGLSVLAPADSWELRALLRASLQQEGPVYMRIGKKGEPAIHSQGLNLAIGKALQLQQGHDAAILATGTILPVAIAAAEVLATAGVSAAIYSFPTVKPLDEATLNQVFSSTSLVATVEEHSVLGGFGGSVAEWLADHPGAKGRLVRFGTRDEFLHLTTEQDEARAHYGLTSEALATALRKLLEESRALPGTLSMA